MRKFLISAAAVALAAVGLFATAPTALAGGHHVTHAKLKAATAQYSEAHPAPDQFVILRCITVPQLMSYGEQMQDNYAKGMPPAGVWVKMGGQNHWYPANDVTEAISETRVICVVVGTPPPPVATTLPTPTTEPPTTAPPTTEAPPTTQPPHEECPPGEHPGNELPGPPPGFDRPPQVYNSHERSASGNYGDEPGQLPDHGHGDHDCVPDETTTTTVAPTTTTEAPTTTVAPTTTTTAPEGPCTGIDDCHIVCNDVAGVDDCNICIGNDSCDVIECPVGFTLNSAGDCVPLPTPPIVTTTTVAPTTTTVAPTTTTVVKCYFPDYLDHGICIVPKPTTTTTVAPTTTTEHVTTTTAAPETTTTAIPSQGGPCDGIQDCHVVCHNVAGVDECNICIGSGDCDVVAEPTPPIVTTTTEASTTTTVAPTTTTHPYCDGNVYKGSNDNNCPAPH